MKKIPFKATIKELIVDYLVILIYLAALLLLNLIYIFIIIGKIPEYTELQTQMIAAFTSVIPICLIFAFLDYKGGSIGKGKAGLSLHFRTKNKAGASLLRNVIKFLPWQLGHMGVIHGMYHDFNTASLIVMNLGTLSAILLLGMRLWRKDQRHIGDMLAKTRVEKSSP